jgi:hypothetical protein
VAELRPSRWQGASGRGEVQRPSGHGLSGSWSGGGSS